MLKPLKQNIKRKVKSEIVVSLKNGVPIYSDSETGEILSMDEQRYTPSFEVFNASKASMFLSGISQGHTLVTALDNASMTKSSMSHWLMSNDEFAAALEKARSTRAHFSHEQFYSVAHDELVSELPDDKEELSIHLAKLKAIEARQKILNIQKREDAPSRFSDKDQHANVSASVAISIDPDAIDKVRARFKSTLDVDGELDTRDSADHLKDILDVDYKEVESE